MERIALSRSFEHNRLRIAWLLLHHIGMELTPRIARETSAYEADVLLLNYASDFLAVLQLGIDL